MAIDLAFKQLIRDYLDGYKKPTKEEQEFVQRGVSKRCVEMYGTMEPLKAAISVVRAKVGVVESLAYRTFLNDLLDAFPIEVEEDAGG